MTWAHHRGKIMVYIRFIIKYATNRGARASEKWMDEDEDEDTDFYRSVFNTYINCSPS